VGWPSQARSAILQSTENMLATWTENQVKRDSSPDLMAIRAKDLRFSKTSMNISLVNSV
jgi:hypothetical protein